MRYFSYIVARDFGFAPNPFFGLCTLATCKGPIRKAARVNDWILGTAGSELPTKGRLVYAMQVCKKVSFNDYFSDDSYAKKKPVLNGSLKQTYGDNIYHQLLSGEWVQADSHHSNPDGSTNLHNLKRDTKSDSVLISDRFYYFGVKAPELPHPLADGLHSGIGFSYVAENIGAQIVNYLEQNYDYGFHGEPAQFTEFHRYDGVS